MDIDEFLDRELGDLNLAEGKTEKLVVSLEHPSMKSFSPSQLFENAKASLSKGNLDEAELSYTQLWHQLLQQRLKWDKDIYEQLLILSRQFSSTLSYAYNDVKKKTSQIYDLINRARASIKEGKKDMAFKIYSEIEGTVNSIPNAFFEEKKTIQEQVVDFYKEIKGVTDNELLRKVSALLQDMYQLIDRINSSIRANDMINAIGGYNKCIELYNQIPEGFLKHKNAAGIRLLEIYKSLSIHTEISNLQKQLTINQFKPNLQVQQQINSNAKIEASQ